MPVKAVKWTPQNRPTGIDKHSKRPTTGFVGRILDFRFWLPTCPRQRCDLVNLGAVLAAPKMRPSCQEGPKRVQKMAIFDHQKSAIFDNSKKSSNIGDFWQLQEILKKTTRHSLLVMGGRTKMAEKSRMKWAPKCLRLRH